MSEQDLTTRLQAAVARHLGATPGEIAELTRLTGGATKVTYSFVAQVGGTTERLVLQISTPRAALSAEDALAALPRVIGKDDAAMMMSAAAAGVPTPRVRGVLTPEDGLGHGYIMAFVPGETIARRILREARFEALRRSFATQCGAILARIHRMDAAKLPFLKRFGAAENVTLYRRAYEACDHPQPVIELGLRWAEDHLPRARPLSVVHGDFRLGNLICDEEKIAAVIDWEIAALGDPMQDLGWLCVKTWRFGGKAPVGGIGSRAELFAVYEQASGMAVDPAEVRFWEAFGSVKWAIMCLMKGCEHLRTGRMSVEQLAIGRRMEEPLYDFLQLIDGKE